MPKTEKLDTMEAPEVVDFNEMDLEKAFDSLVDAPKENESDDTLILSDDADKPKDDTESDDKENKETDDSEDKDSDDIDSSDDKTDTKNDDDSSEIDDKDDVSDDKKPDKDLTLVDELSQRLGLEGEESFEDSVDGLVNLAREASNQLAEQQLLTLFEELPDVQQFMQFRLQGGTAESFFETMYPTEDYVTLKVSEDDTGLQERLVRKALEARGLEIEDVDETIDEFKTSGILFSQAEKALKGLKKFQTHEKEQLIEKQQAVADQSAQDQAVYLKEVKETISSSSDFKGVVVNEKEKDAFFSYVSDPVKDGQSQYTIDVQEAPVEVHLAIAALMRKKFNFAGLISRKASSQRASNLRERIKGEKARLRSQEDKKKGHVDLARVEDLDLSL